MAKSGLIATPHDVKQPLCLVEMPAVVSVDGENLLALRGHEALEVDVVFVLRPFDEQVLQVQVNSAGSHDLDARPVRLSSTLPLILRNVFVKPEQTACH